MSCHHRDLGTTLWAASQSMLYQYCFPDNVWYFVRNPTMVHPLAQTTPVQLPPRPDASMPSCHLH